MDYYTNLEIHINFASYGSDTRDDDIAADIEKLLEKYGYSMFSRESGPEPMGQHHVHKVTFFPKECTA
jgi:hypothetical protein